MNNADSIPAQWAASGTSRPSPKLGQRRRAWRHLQLPWVLALFSLSTAEAAIRDVCPSSCTYASIQAAVDAAAPGDTIDIGPGTYIEVVQVDVADLGIVGAGAGLTIIDGPLSAVVFEAGAGNATLSGVTLHSRVLGSCIQNYAALTVRDSVVEDCYHESNGGGIYTSGDLVLERVSVFSATASPSVTGHGRGGGLYVDGNATSGGPTVRIYDSVFANNQALFGGAIYVGTGATVFVDGTTFTGNNAGDPSGLHLYTGRGGAIRTFGTLHVTHSTFFYNSADLFGGAIAVNCTEAPVWISNSVIFENYTGADSFSVGALPSGGGLYVESGGEVRIIGSELYGNVAGYGGGIGVYNLLQQGTVTLNTSSLISNRALGDGGGLWV